MKTYLMIVIVTMLSFIAGIIDQDRSWQHCVGTLLMMFAGVIIAYWAMSNKEKPKCH